jgi:hypothetical protein
MASICQETRGESQQAVRGRMAGGKIPIDQGFPEATVDGLMGGGWGQGSQAEAVQGQACPCRDKPVRVMLNGSRGRRRRLTQRRRARRERLRTRRQ